MLTRVDYASRMTDTVLARNIVALRQHLGDKQAAFAERIGTQQANVSKWENGTTPDHDNLDALAELAGVTAREFRDEPWFPARPSAKASNMTADDFAAELGLALIDEVDLAIGMGATYLDGRAEIKGRAPFRIEWLRGLYDGPISALKVVTGRGDSMEPTIRDRDIVLLDTSSKRLDEQDMIWAVSYGELGMIRRLRRLPSGAVLLSPDNPVVGAIEAHDGEMFIMGRVIFIGRRMG